MTERKKYILYKWTNLEDKNNKWRNNRMTNELVAEMVPSTTLNIDYGLQCIIRLLIEKQNGQWFRFFHFLMLFANSNFSTDNGKIRSYCWFISFHYCKARLLRIQPQGYYSMNVLKALERSKRVVTTSSMCSNTCNPFSMALSFSPSS